MFNPSELAPIRKRTVSITGILDDAFQIIKRRFALFFGLAALMIVPFSLLTAFLNARATPDYQTHVQRLKSLTDRVTAGFTVDQSTLTNAVVDVAKDVGKMVAIGGTLSLLEYSLLGSAMAIAVGERYARRDTTISRCYLAAFKRLPATVASALVLAIGLLLIAVAPAAAAALAGATGLAVVLLLISLIFVVFFGVRSSLYMPAVILEARNIGALKRSYQLTSGFFWKTFGVLALTSVTVGLLIYLTDTIVLHLTRNSEPINVVINLLISTATMPLVLCAQTLLFLDLKTVREGFGIEQLVTALNAIE